jgi:streptogramin lyase
MTPAGVATSFHCRAASPVSIVAGWTAQWYTASSADVWTRRRSQITEYRLPSAAAPIGVVVGPNNVMWITNSNSAVNKISMWCRRLRRRCVQ